MRTCALPHPPTAMPSFAATAPPPPLSAAYRCVAPAWPQGRHFTNQNSVQIMHVIGVRAREIFTPKHTYLSRNGDKANALSFYFKRPLAGSSASKRTRCRALARVPNRLRVQLCRRWQRRQWQTSSAGNGGNQAAMQVGMTVRVQSLKRDKRCSRNGSTAAARASVANQATGTRDAHSSSLKTREMFMRRKE
jgi:hypothetical protein